MNWARRIMLTLLALILSLGGGIWWFFPTDSFNVRISTRVIAGGEERLVSTTLRVRESFELSETFDFFVKIQAQGEGGYVELADGRVLVMLLSSPMGTPLGRSPNTIFAIANTYAPVLRTRQPTMMRGYEFWSPVYRELTGRPFTIPEEFELAYAIVSDVNDWRSAKVVSRSELASQGIEVSRQSAEVTEYPPTAGKLMDRLKFIKGAWSILHRVGPTPARFEYVAP